MAYQFGVGNPQVLVRSKVEYGGRNTLIICAWIYWLGGGAANIAVAWNAGDSTSAFLFQISANKLFGASRSSSAVVTTVTGSTTLQPYRWYFVSYSYTTSPAATRVHLEGVQDGSTNNTSLALETINAMRIGLGSPSSPSDQAYYPCMIAQVSMYSIDYQSRLKDIKNDPYGLPGLLGLWDFTEPCGPIIDKSGNGAYADVVRRGAQWTPFGPSYILQRNPDVPIRWSRMRNVLYNLGAPTTGRLLEYPGMSGRMKELTGRTHG